MQSNNKNETIVSDIPTLYITVEFKFAQLIERDAYHYSFASSYLETCERQAVANLVKDVEETLQLAKQLLICTLDSDTNEVRKKILYMQIWIANMKYFFGAPYQELDVYTDFVKSIALLNNSKDILFTSIDKPMYLQLIKLAALKKMQANGELIVKLLVYYADIGAKPKADKNADTWCIYWCRLHLYAIAYGLALGTSDRHLTEEIGKKFFDFYNQTMSIAKSSENPDTPDQALWYGMLKLDAGLFFPKYFVKEGNLDFQESNKEVIKKFCKFVYDAHKKHILVSGTILENSTSNNVLYIRLVNRTLASIDDDIRYFRLVRTHFKTDKNFHDLLVQRINELFDTQYRLCKVITQRPACSVKIGYAQIDEKKKQFEIELTSESAEKSMLQLVKSLDAEAGKKTTIAAKAKVDKKTTIAAKAKVDKQAAIAAKAEAGKQAAIAAKAEADKQAAFVAKTEASIRAAIAAKAEAEKQAAIAAKAEAEKQAAIAVKKAQDVPKKSTNTSPHPKPSVRKPQKTVVTDLIPENVIPKESIQKSLIATSTKFTPTLFQPENTSQKIVDKKQPVYEFDSFVTAQKRLQPHLDRLMRFITQQIQNQDFLYGQDITAFTDTLQKIQEEADYTKLCEGYCFFTKEAKTYPDSQALQSHCMNIQNILSAVHSKMQYLETHLPLLKQILGSQYVPDRTFVTQQNSNSKQLKNCLDGFNKTRNAINFALEKENIAQIFVYLPPDVQHIFDLLGKASQTCYLVGSSAAGLVTQSDITGKDRDYILLNANIGELMNLGFVKNEKFKHLTVYSAVIKLPDNNCVPVDVLCLEEKDWLEKDLRNRNFINRVYCNKLGIIHDFSGDAFEAIRKKSLDIPGDPVQRLQQSPEILLQIADKLLDNYVFPDTVMLAVKNWTQGDDYSSKIEYIHAVAKKYTTKWGAEIFTEMLHSLGLLKPMFNIIYENREISAAALKAQIEKPLPSWLRKNSLFESEKTDLSGGKTLSFNPLHPTSQS